MGSKRLVLPVRLNYDDEARRWYVMSAPVCGVSSVVAECYSRSDADAVIAALNSNAERDRLAAQLRERDGFVWAMLDTLACEGGCIVSSADCSVMEIADARVRGDFLVDNRGYGWVRRLPEWMQRHSRFARDAAPDCCEPGEE